MCQNTAYRLSVRDTLISMRIGFVGGGTGGHFYPLIAVAEVLVDASEKPELYYFGPDQYDADLLREHNITFVSCPAGKLRLYFSIQNFFDIFRNFIGIFVGIIKLYTIYPDVIFSKGGYTSVPILIAARFLRIPVVIHESDAVPGRANLLAKKFARYIAISYPEAAQYFDAKKVALTGIPIRRALLTTDPDPFGTLGIPNDLPLVYVTGGSSGAERINNLVLSSLEDLLPQCRVFHQAGDAHKNNLIPVAQTLITDPVLQSRYHLEGSLSATTVNALLSAASVVITRAGSTTLFEIGLHGTPSIIVPIPEDISRDQRSNAYAFARGGGATVIEEHNLTKALLVAEIRSIIGSPEHWQEMSAAAKKFVPTDAAQTIATSLIQIGHEHGS
jgi:UDP-N-acetylglucosamine--N-acetylmuramyl-(pentapeptide) pyrophosphoryl-undecaprenol N-acetylglucosamine transferase